MKKKQIMASDLVDEIIRRGYRRIAAEEIVNLVFDRIMDSVASGYKVRINGFGAFEAKHRAPRTARNPRTNEPVRIPARVLPVFTPGKDFKDKLGGEDNG